MSSYAASDLFALICRAEHLPEPIAEFVFAPPRKWRFDFCWVTEKLALEVQGGIFTQGRHTRGAALLKEHEKLNAAAVLGFRVLYLTPDTLLTVGPDLVRQAIGERSM